MFDRHRYEVSVVVISICFLGTLLHHCVEEVSILELVLVHFIHGRRQHISICGSYVAIDWVLIVFWLEFRVVVNVKMSRIFGGKVQVINGFYHLLLWTNCVVRYRLLSVELL